MTGKTTTILKAALALSLASSAVVLAGCKAENRYMARRDTITLSAGEAVARNNAIQVADPWPRLSQDNNFNTDGKRMMVGIQRYQKNESLEPVGADTTERFDEEQAPAGSPAPSS